MKNGKKVLIVVLIITVAIIVYFTFKNKSDDSINKANSTISEKQNIKENESEIDIGKKIDEFKNSKKEINKLEKYSVYELCFNSIGNNIYGQLYLPNTIEEKVPLAVICHGFCGSYKDSANYAEYCAKEGIAAYVFDFCGGAIDSASDGNIEDMSIITEKNDLERIILGFDFYDFIDKDKMFLIGESQGGTVAAIYASRSIKKIAGMVLLYPAFNIPDDARRLYNDRTGIPNNPEVLGVTVGRKYYEDAIDMDIHMETIGFQNPVLIIHGDRDNVVPISYSQEATTMYNDAKLITINGSDHGFYGDDLKEAARQSVEFIKMIMSS